MSYILREVATMSNAANDDTITKSMVLMLNRKTRHTPLPSSEFHLSSRNLPNWIIVKTH